MRIQCIVRDLVQSVTIIKKWKCQWVFRTFRGAVTLAGSAKVVAQINQHNIKNQQPTFKSIDHELLVLIIVDCIAISLNQPSYENDCYHIPVQKIIELKHFLCSILDQEFCYLSLRKWSFGLIVV